MKSSYVENANKVENEKKCSLMNQNDCFKDYKNTLLSGQQILN